MTPVEAHIDCITSATLGPGRSATQTYISWSRSFRRDRRRCRGADLKESGLTSRDARASSCSTVTDIKVGKVGARSTAASG